uniref:Uncharacterized protein n=1 Tax=Cacopsylla melanoneura TaxID=428564 RepID=A0A8D9DV53_9HEMI
MEPHNLSHIISLVNLLVSQLLRHFEKFVFHTTTDRRIHFHIEFIVLDIGVEDSIPFHVPMLVSNLTNILGKDFILTAEMNDGDGYKGDTQSYPDSKDEHDIDINPVKDLVGPGLCLVNVRNAERKGQSPLRVCSPVDVCPYLQLRFSQR